MGPENAGTRMLLMDATESVMRDEGYAAVTSRRVAERAGVNQQTVYYYFETMDDLLLATYRRRIERLEAAYAAAATSDRPLRAFWETSSEPHDAVLTMEYLALSNHNEAIRRETVEYGERSRRAHVARLSAALGSMPVPAAVSPFAVVMAMTYISHLKGFEEVLGLTGGHEEVAGLMEWCLAQLEPAK